MNSDRTTAVCLAILLLTGCGDTTAPAASSTAPAFPVFDDPELQLGRHIWTDNCQVCHATGLAGAPVIGRTDLWKPRIGQGVEVLVEHALNGFLGPTGTEMPPRGGNTDLSDAEVRSAVLYMVAASKE